MRLHVEPLEDRRMLSADAVLDWNAVSLDAIKNDYDVGGHPDQGGPGRSARALAIVHVAMHDAVMAIDGEYMPLVFRFPAVAGTSLDAAVSQAAHDTLAALFPQQRSMFDAALATSLLGIPARSGNLGVQLGSFVARVVLAARANDGADGPMDYTPGTQPGDYRPDPLHPDQMVIGPDWNLVDGFVIRSGTQFPAPPPPALTSQAYTDNFNQVKTLGADGINSPTTRTAEQTEIGIYWAYDGTADIGTPPRLYNQMARVIAEQQHNTEVENARLFALVNVAMHDVGVVLWTTKYEENFWRPITGIRESDPGTGPSGLGDGNPNTIGDPDWTPLGSPASNGSGTNFTPAFPAYTSGHAGFGASVFRTIRNFYGTDNIAFTFTSDELNGVTLDAGGSVRPLAPRSFSTLSQAARENANSRVYLGVHWQFDVDLGMIQGTRMADYVFTHFARHNLTFQVLHRIGHLLHSLGPSGRNLVEPALESIDQALATTDFHPNAGPDPLASALSNVHNLLPSLAASVSRATAGRPSDSLDFVNTPLSDSFVLPSTAKPRAGLAAC
ncbi:MAG: chloroperoxidase [Pirellulales bacterium]